MTTCWWNISPKVAVSRLVNSLKGVSSRLLRKERPTETSAILPALNDGVCRAIWSSFQLRRCICPARPRAVRAVRGCGSRAIQASVGVLEAASHLLAHLAKQQQGKVFRPPSISRLYVSVAHRPPRVRRPICMIVNM